MAIPKQDPVAGTEPSLPIPDDEPGHWLTDLLIRAVNAHNANEEEETIAALEALCSAARNVGIPIEGVLVPLKQVWQARTASDIPLRPGPTEDRLARLVSSCISTYYSPS